jgi:hypothetical protein
MDVIINDIDIDEFLKLKAPCLKVDYLGSTVICPLYFDVPIRISCGYDNGNFWTGLE